MPMSSADQEPQPELATTTETATAVVRGVVPMSELPAFFDRAFGALGPFLSERGVAPSGPPFARYLSQPGATCDLEVGFPIAAPVRPAGEVVPSSLPGGRVATVVHRGGYEGLAGTWGSLMGWVAANRLRPAPGFWEVYLTEPTPDGDPADNRTALYVPVQD
jgi:effector-binding domain-containing protein